MDATAARFAELLGWFLGQSVPVQAVFALLVLAALYPVLLVLRVLIVALYGAFRGLG
ncbi:MAG: hypothetical protein MUE39_09140 [Gammaproteobacteria bacterium]|jgi:hypothetical protein|nr:hypothetical protein [Gammaproteobacteria bacterium]